MMGKKAFLLCAGEGTRFRPWTLTLPKPLIPFLNLPLCAYNLYLLKKLGVQHIIANIHAHPHLLKKELHILAQKVGLSPPAFSFEETLLGSAGGLGKVRDFFIPKGENCDISAFFYLNGDSFIWPATDSTLLDFYSAHLSSGALASFLVRPAMIPKIRTHNTNKAYIYAENDMICSFSQAPDIPTKAKPYAFSGLAVFSPSIFNEIARIAKSINANPASNLHIFKDVLNLPRFKGHLRAHIRPHSPFSSATPYTHCKAKSSEKRPSCMSTASHGLELLDMNQLSSYLQGTKIALAFLSKQRKGSFLHKVLDLYTPHWRRYEGENWFSAECVDKPPTHIEDILFCGPKVKGLNHLLVKDFAVLGEGALVSAPLSMTGSVLGKGADLNTSLQRTLKL